MDGAARSGTAGAAEDAGIEVVPGTTREVGGGDGGNGVPDPELIG